jgi:shikimate dehydrogenase
MHNAAFAALGLDAFYEAIDVPPSGLGEAIESLRDGRLLGVNVTIPYKSEILELVDAVSEDASRTGAANTLVPVADRLIAHNTDAPAVIHALRTETGLDPAGADVVILGAGGAARAAACGLLEAGAARVGFFNRTAQRARAVVDQLSSHYPSRLGTIEGPDALISSVRACNFLINATSVGMWPHNSASPLPPGLLPEGGMVYDLVYRPRRTVLLAAAEEAGLPVLGGLGMLVAQAALALKLWTGFDPPVALLRATAESVLDDSSAWPEAEATGSSNGDA